MFQSFFRSIIVLFCLNIFLLFLLEGSSTNEQLEGNDDAEEEDADAEVEGEEDESDMDLAWKMLDIARVIAEKCPEDTLEKVNIFSALAEVSMERGYRTCVFFCFPK
jgi:hypothetical protein